MNLLLGIAALGIIAVGLMTLYAALIWSHYKQMHEAAEAVDTLHGRADGPEENGDVETITVQRLPGQCDRCGAPSPSGLCDDCREDADPFTDG